MVSDSEGTTGVEGEGKLGVTERVEGEGAFAIGASGGHRSIGEGNGASASKPPSGGSADISTSISAANSLSRSITSSTPLRNPSPSLSSRFPCLFHLLRARMNPSWFDKLFTRGGEKKSALSYEFLYGKVRKATTILKG